MDLFITGVQVALGFGALLSLYRAIKGPELADRIVAVDLLLLMLAGGIAAQSGRDGSDYFMAVLIVVSLMAFVGTVLVARFIEWRDVQ
jgi:multicomponent Na+:H+ antiporter subunit F